MLPVILRHGADAEKPNPLGLDGIRSTDHHFIVLAEGFVLAGGKSSRMGTEKGLLPFRGRTLVENAVTVLGGLGIQVRVVVSRQQQLPVCKELQITDLVEEAGPLGGLYTALEGTSCSLIFLLACDLPLVPGSLFEWLASERKEADLVAPKDSRGRLQPLSGMYSVSCLQTVEQRLRDGKRSMHDLFSCPGLQSRTVNAAALGYPDELFLNVNSPGDWNLLMETEAPDLE